MKTSIKLLIAGVLMVASHNVPAWNQNWGYQAPLGQGTDWGSYDNYLQHGWQHDAPHVAPHVLPHMHSDPHPDALAYPIYQQRQYQQNQWGGY